MERKEIKDSLILLVLVIPMFGLMMIGWLSSPMYKQNWNIAQAFLTATYYHQDKDVPQRQALIKRFGFTDEDINPKKILEHFMVEQQCKKDKTPPNQNLGQ